MGLFIYIEQIFWIHVRVPLGSREAGMTEQLLNRAKVASPLEQMSGEGVPERMSARLGLHIRAEQPTMDNSPDCTV